MSATTLDDANAAMRAAVKARLEGSQVADATKRENCCNDRKFYGHTQAVHPTSQKFFDLCDRLKAMHASKSKDYGCPSGTDPLANIRNGAKFVGIPSWRAAMVRLSDKVTRLATFNATGKLQHESVIDTLEDLASYSLLALLLYQEENSVRD